MKWSALERARDEPSDGGSVRRARDLPRSGGFERERAALRVRVEVERWENKETNPAFGSTC